MIEQGRTMVLHSVIIGILLYIFMIFILKQKQEVAENRSILLAAVVLAYMILFGHGLPTSINKNLF
jgi:ACR3 family arsenite efflux pump ArsB